MKVVNQELTAFLQRSAPCETAQKRLTGSALPKAVISQQGTSTSRKVTASPEKTTERLAHHESIQEQEEGEGRLIRTSTIHRE